jgi:predicted nucleic acid-binding protein
MGQVLDARKGSVLSLWLIDTGVWLRIAAGADVVALLDSKRVPAKDEVLASAITIAEVTSVLCRQGKRKDVGRLLGFLRRLSTIQPLTETGCEAAGFIHADERARTPNLSLADAIILAQAKSAGAVLVTTDATLARNRQRVRTRVVG